MSEKPQCSEGYAVRLELHRYLNTLANAVDRLCSARCQIAFKKFNESDAQLGGLLKINAR